MNHLLLSLTHSGLDVGTVLQFPVKYYCLYPLLDAVDQVIFQGSVESSSHIVVLRPGIECFVSVRA